MNNIDANTKETNTLLKNEVLFQVPLVVQRQLHLNLTYDDALKRVKVDGINPSSKAKDLIQINDEILALNGVDVKDIDSIKSIVSNHNKDTIKMKVERLSGGKNEFLLQVPLVVQRQLHLNLTYDDALKRVKVDGINPSYIATEIIEINDKILALNGVDVKDIDSIKSIVSNHDKDTIEMKVERLLEKEELILQIPLVRKQLHLNFRYDDISKRVRVDGLRALCKAKNLVQTNDEILTLNGMDIGDIDCIKSILSDYKAETIEMKVIRHYAIELKEEKPMYHCLLVLFELGFFNYLFSKFPCFKNIIDSCNCIYNHPNVAQLTLVVGYGAAIYFFYKSQISSHSCDLIYGFLPPSYLFVLLDVSLFEFMRSIVWKVLFLGKDCIYKELFVIWTRIMVCTFYKSKIKRSEGIELSDIENPMSKVISLESRDLRIVSCEESEESEDNFEEYDSKASLIMIQLILSLYPFVLICINFPSGVNSFRSYQNFCGLVIYSNILMTTISLLISRLEDCLELFLSDYLYILDGLVENEYGTYNTLRLAAIEIWNETSNSNTIRSFFKMLRSLTTHSFYNILRSGQILYGAVGIVATILIYCALCIQLLVLVLFITHIIPGYTKTPNCSE